MAVARQTHTLQIHVAWFHARLAEPFRDTVRVRTVMLAWPDTFKTGMLSRLMSFRAGSFWIRQGTRPGPSALSC
jgi:hypothetical protein